MQIPGDASGRLDELAHEQLQAPVCFRAGRVCVLRSGRLVDEPEEMLDPLAPLLDGAVHVVGLEVSLRLPRLVIRLRPRPRFRRAHTLAPRVVRLLAACSATGATAVPTDCGGPRAGDCRGRHLADGADDEVLRDARDDVLGNRAASPVRVVGVRPCSVDVAKE